ncbi:AAA family ATPase [Oleisolibacter albus]|uniref:bifunctional aminoglycoside phosphotransferase/ATP-binding protein n=1 Tax=Oleisolibacter albus TaxID=2171757 RepID=UPI000DF4C2C0|nr:bifunctional aminoglycoside phosphotransferase/ATP-binding protein [Oleisolibacter albus]
MTAQHPGGADPQAAVMALLGDPATHGGAPVERIDTHANSVFLAGDRAYKLKRAVRFPFLDFSTLARRLEACRAELVLNRRTAPDLYLGLGAVVRTAEGRLRLLDHLPRDEGDLVEPVVRMRRFRQEDLAAHIADAGGLTPPVALALADTVAAFHEAADPRPDGPGVPEIAHLIAMNTQQLRQHAALFPAEAVTRLDRRGQAALDRHGGLIDRRRQAGYVRHCHGDLHLRNIVLVDGRPQPFDCVEFDESLAVTDVLYDLAYLLMDLEHRRLRPVANLVFNRYLDQTEDLAGLALLPLFLSIRAGIRAHLTAAGAAVQSDPGQAEALRAEARAYFDLALALVQPPRGRLLAIGGLSGTGKTTLARHLAPEIGPAPGAVILRSDVLRKRLLGCAETDRLPPDGYAEAVTDRVYAEMDGRAGLVLDGRHAVICDAVYARTEQRRGIEAVAQAAGMPFTGLWLVADQQTQLARVSRRSGDASDATVEVVRRQAAYDLGEMTWDVIAASGPAEETVAVARRLCAG